MTRRAPGSFTSSPSRYGLPCVLLVPGVDVDRVAAGERATSSRVSSRSSRWSSTHSRPGQPGQLGDGLLHPADPRRLVVPQGQDEAEPRAGAAVQAR